MADIVRTSRLADGSAAPSNLELPRLLNRDEVLRYMLEHYPADLHDRADFEMPWAWLFVDEKGRGIARIVKSSGHQAFDSLAVAALRIARFAPATVNRKSVGVWTPLPIQVTYQHLAERAIPERAQDPRFTPYTVKPELLNRAEVAKALARNYPPSLRASGIGGQVVLWVFIDEAGRALSPRVRTSSGDTLLDRAAVAVARTMRFSPARNGQAITAVWIMLPVVFKPESAPPKR